MLRMAEKPNKGTAVSSVVTEVGTPVQAEFATERIFAVKDWSPRSSSITSAAELWLSPKTSSRRTATAESVGSRSRCVRIRSGSGRVPLAAVALSSCAASTYEFRDPADQ